MILSDLHSKPLCIVCGSMQDCNLLLDSCGCFQNEHVGFLDKSNRFGFRCLGMSINGHSLGMSIDGDTPPKNNKCPQGSQAFGVTRITDITGTHFEKHLSR